MSDGEQTWDEWHYRALAERLAAALQLAVERGNVVAKLPELDGYAARSVKNYPNDWTLVVRKFAKPALAEARVAGLLP